MFELHDKVALITGAAGGLGDKLPVRCISRAQRWR